MNRFFRMFMLGHLWKIMMTPFSSFFLSFISTQATLRYQCSFCFRNLKRGPPPRIKTAPTNPLPKTELFRPLAASQQLVPAHFQPAFVVQVWRPAQVLLPSSSSFWHVRTSLVDDVSSDMNRSLPSQILQFRLNRFKVFNLCGAAFFLLHFKEMYFFLKEETVVAPLPSISA